MKPAIVLLDIDSVYLMRHALPEPDLDFTYNIMNLYFSSGMFQLTVSIFIKGALLYVKLGCVR